MNTQFLPSQAIFSNGQITGNAWGSTYNIFLVDGDFATSNVGQGSASDFIISNFNFNIPVGSIVNGIEVQIIGLTGAPTSPAISLDVSYYDNTDGADAFYPYTSAITSLSPTLSTITIGTSTYLFGTTFTVDQINNFKLALTANGDISLDCVLVKVYYTGPATNTLEYNSLTGTFDVGETITDGITGATAVIVTDNGANSMTVTGVTGFFQDGDSITGGTSGATALLDAPTPGVCIDCSSPIQVQAMFLELPFLIGQTKFYLKKGSFAYPDGTPVQSGDIGSCGGTIPFVFDESKRKVDGQNFEENAMLDTNDGGTWTVLSSGVIEVDIGAVTHRGLGFKAPGTHDANLMSDHDANSKVIISNNEPYNLTLVRRCQEGTVFAGPVTVQDEGVNVTTYLKLMNFVGNGVTATLAALNHVLVTITDQFIKVSNVDTTPGYLTDKLVAGSNITLTPSGAGNETITIAATGGGGSGITSINGNTTAAQVIAAGSGISVSSVAGTTTITNTGGGGGSGTVTSITAGTGLSGGTITTTGTIALVNTAVTPGAYTNLNATIDAQGRITAAANGSSGIVAKSILTTKLISDASTTQVIAHGLGKTPTQVVVEALFSVATNIALNSDGVFDQGGNKCIFSLPPGGSPFPLATDNSSSFAIGFFTSSGNGQSGVISVDATNVTITWTKNGTPTTTVAQILLKCFA